MSRPFFTDEERNRLIAEYQIRADRGEAKLLANEMGRTPQHLARHAKRLGLTDANRARPYAEKNIPRFTTENHPRGMKGKKHSSLTKDRMSVSQFKNWHAKSKDSQIAIVSNAKRSWKAGWREIGGVRSYYRSRWEANYARYLEWLKELGKIKSWVHEPKTFWFLKIKRGHRSYLPDFLVEENNGDQHYHEVKGWMDAGSKTKIKRMAKYYPNVVLIVIDSKVYKSIANKIGRAIPGWE